MSSAAGRFMKGWGTIRYQWFLYSFGTVRFTKIVLKTSKKFGIDITGAVRDDLWCLGLVAERGSGRMSKELRKMITLELEGVTARRRVKNTGMIERQKRGRETLERECTLMGFLMLCNEDGLAMWHREWGILLMTGMSWAYVYKTDQSISFGDDLKEIGYFQLAGGDVKGQLVKAMNGGMTYRTKEHKMRTKQYMSRRMVRVRAVRTKRKTP